MTRSDPVAPKALRRRAFLLGIAALGVGVGTKLGVDRARHDTVASGAVSGISVGDAGSPTSSNASIGGPGPTNSAPPTGTVAAPPTTAMARPEPPGPARYVSHGDRTRNEVALTFHTNGDPMLVARLADFLAAAAVPATFFVVGEWGEAQPVLLRRLVAEGHELANHTWSHAALTELSRVQIVQEILRCRELLEAYAGGPVRYFRPSAIDVPTEEILVAAGTAGYEVSLGYDVDPLDYTDPGPAAIVAATAAAVDRGSIISLHTGHIDTVAAMVGLTALLGARGLRPVTCSTLLR